MPSSSSSQTPYKIAVLVYVYNSAGQLLLLRRAKAPNRGLYSPIGGKLEMGIGESPYACALREIEEEIGVTLSLNDIRLVGIVSERGFGGPGVTAGTGGAVNPGAVHWLMFCFDVLRPLDFPGREMDEGVLEWVDTDKVRELTIPRTDRDVILPLIEKHSWGFQGKGAGKAADGAFFAVHIDCTGAEAFAVTHEHPVG